jgi:hypothetical protein
MYDAKKLRDRYQHDAEFCVIVDSLEAYIKTNGVNPMELREAVFFACLKYQQENVDPLLIDGKWFTFKDALTNPTERR